MLRTRSIGGPSVVVPEDHHAKRVNTWAFLESRKGGMVLKLERLVIIELIIS
jgi:hypothetical protein